MNAKLNPRIKKLKKQEIFVPKVNRNKAKVSTREKVNWRLLQSFFTINWLKIIAELPTLIFKKIEIEKEPVLEVI